jgi:hypothetical protein
VGIVANTDLVKQAVGRWEASDIAFIRSFGFESCDGPNFDLVLLTLLQPRPPLSAGWPDPDGPFWEIAIAFERVRNLSLIVEGPWDIQSEGFVIEDISTWQWEGVRLRVHDYEEGPYRFDAWSATIRSCVPAHRGPGCPAISRVYPGVYPEGRGRRLL